MPENTQFTIIQFSCCIGFHGLIYAKILMISGKDFSCMSTGVVIQNKVFKQIKEVFFLANTTEHCFKGNATLIFFCKSLPLMEKLILTAKSTNLRLCTIRQHKKRIVIKQMRNCILIICIIIIVCVLHIDCIFFQFYKQQWNTINKTYNVCSAAI